LCCYHLRTGHHDDGLHLCAHVHQHCSLAKTVGSPVAPHAVSLASREVVHAGIISVVPEQHSTAQHGTEWHGTARQYHEPVLTSTAQLVASPTMLFGGMQSAALVRATCLQALLASTMHAQQRSTCHAVLE
jgi:hypothetical protein